MFEPINVKAIDFFAVSQPDAVRLFHGRGQLHPGLEHISIDWYPPVLLITVYQDDDQLPRLAEQMQAADIDGQIASISVQSRNHKGTPVQWLFGEPIEKCVVQENDLMFEVQPSANQNVGLFLDMQPLRFWLTKNSDGKNLLNLFAYTCSLSVAALAGNARQVVNVDMSKPSIQWGERNHSLNGHDLRNVRSVPHNVFRSWGRLQQFGGYDTIIIDPPSRQRGSFNAEKSYVAVIKKLKQLANPNADIIATINSPYLNEEFLIKLFSRYAPECRFVEMMPGAPEFEDKYPERALKIYRFKAV